MGHAMENIVRALLSTAAFLELSGDEVVDTDAAVQALEQLSGYLQRAGEAEREVNRSNRQGVGCRGTRQGHRRRGLREFL